MSTVNWRPATEPGYRWVSYADESYVEARTLYAENFVPAFALLAANSIESYLNVDYPDEFANGYHVMLDSEEGVTALWDQVEPLTPISQPSQAAETVLV